MKQKYIFTCKSAQKLLQNKSDIKNSKMTLNTMSSIIINHFKQKNWISIQHPQWKDVVGLNIYW